MITFERWEDGGCYVIKDDTIGLAQTKSRNVARRICDALNVPNLLIGRTVESSFGSAVVCSVSSDGLVVRRENGALGHFPVLGSKVVEPKSEAGVPTGEDGELIPDPPFRTPSLLNEDEIRTILTALGDGASKESKQVAAKLSRWWYADSPSMWTDE